MVVSTMRCHVVTACRLQLHVTTTERRTPNTPSKAGLALAFVCRPSALSERFAQCELHAIVSETGLEAAVAASVPNSTNAGVHIALTLLVLLHECGSMSSTSDVLAFT
jgi:hypothetical protein